MERFQRPHVMATTSRMNTAVSSSVPITKLYWTVESLEKKWAEYGYPVSSSEDSKFLDMTKNTSHLFTRITALENQWSIYFGDDPKKCHFAQRDDSNSLALMTDILYDLEQKWTNYFGVYETKFSLPAYTDLCELAGPGTTPREVPELKPLIGNHGVNAGAEQVRTGSSATPRRPQPNHGGNAGAGLVRMGSVATPRPPPPPPNNGVRTGAGQFRIMGSTTIIPRPRLSAQNQRVSTGAGQVRMVAASAKPSKTKAPRPSPPKPTLSPDQKRASAAALLSLLPRPIPQGSTSTECPKCLASMSRDTLSSHMRTCREAGWGWSLPKPECVYGTGNKRCTYCGQKCSPSIFDEHVRKCKNRAKAQAKVRALEKVFAQAFEKQKGCWCECPNPKCKVTIKKKNIEKHLNKCKFSAYKYKTTIKSKLKILQNT